MQITAPAAAEANHTNDIAFQLVICESLAIPYAEIALPMYVHALRIPDTADQVVVFASKQTACTSQYPQRCATLAKWITLLYPALQDLICL